MQYNSLSDNLVLILDSFIVILPMSVLYFSGVIFGKRLPTGVKTGLIVLFSVIIAVLHYLIGRNQVADLGFMARQRTPLPLVMNIELIFAALGLINIGLAFANRLLARRVLYGIAVVLPYFYLLTW